MPVMRIGIVGSGHIGTVHAYALQQLIRAELVDADVVAAYDRDPDRARRLTELFTAATVAPTLDALLDDVDVVWNCTWTAGHLEVVTAAADRGLPIFCEKPLAPSFAECELVAAQLRRVPHQVGLVLHGAPVYRAIAEIVASGQYGRPLTTIFRDDQYFPIQGFYGSTWRADVTKAGGGTLIEHSIHDVDLVRMIFGDPAEVQARTNTRFGHPGIEDLASLLLTYADGSTLSLISVWHQILSRESTRRVEVFLEDALLTTSDDYLGPLVIETVDGEESRLAPPPVWMDRFELPEVYAKPLAQYAEASKAFLDGLAADSAYHGSPDVEDALGAHRLVDLAYRSAASGGVALAR